MRVDVKPEYEQSERERKKSRNCYYDLLIPFDYIEIEFDIMLARLYNVIICVHAIWAPSSGHLSSNDSLFDIIAIREKESISFCIFPSH